MFRNVLRYSIKCIKKNSDINAQFSNNLFNPCCVGSTNYSFDRFYASYGESSLREYKHSNIFRDIGVCDDSIPDDFVKVENLIESENRYRYNHRDFSFALSACLKLKRYKLGLSIVDFAIATKRMDSKGLINVFKLISEAYTHQALSFEKGQEMVEKMLPFVQDVPQFISSQINETAMLFSKNSDNRVVDGAEIIANEEFFVSLITHAIRRRDLNEMRNIFKRFPCFSVYGTIMIEEWFKWIEEVPSDAAELTQLFLSPLIENYEELPIGFAETFIHRFNKISHLPSFEKVEINDNRKCPQCSSSFDPSPLLTDEEFAEFKRFIYEYAKFREIPSKEFSRIEHDSKKLLYFKKTNEFSHPLCLADVPNLIHGKTYLGNVKHLSSIVNQLLSNFSAVELFSKFRLPFTYSNQLSQMAKVLYFQTDYDDDIMLLLMYTKCGSNTYYVTNDQFVDHLSYLDDFKCSVPKKRLQKLLGCRNLTLNREAGVIEPPNHFSPFVQKTSSGFHLPLRRPFIAAKQIYDYYCCHKLF